MEKRAEIVALERKLAWQIARKRGTIKAMAEGAAKESVQVVEKIKASVRAYVEHPFDLVKNIFQHGKVRYRRAGQERASTVCAVWVGQRGHWRAVGHGVKNPERRQRRRSK